jgi:deoxycytidylate deaminase
MGAALFSGSRLVSLGFNTYYKSHPDHHAHGRVGRCFENIHAEQGALIKRKHYEDTNLIMYVWRELESGQAASSKPCPMCMTLMTKAGVKKVRFMEIDGSWAEIRL